MHMRGERRRSEDDCRREEATRRTLTNLSTVAKLHQFCRRFSFVSDAQWVINYCQKFSYADGNRLCRQTLLRWTLTSTMDTELSAFSTSFPLNMLITLLSENKKELLQNNDNNAYKQE